MRVPIDASDQQIQKILTEVVQRDQCPISVQSVSSKLDFEDFSPTEAMNENFILMIHRSGISIENYFRQELWEAQKEEEECVEILGDLTENKKEIMKNNETYRIKSELLLVHIDNQAEDVQYWRVAVPHNKEIKRKILNECHTFPYSAHPGVQRSLNKLRQKFFWKGAD